ncbi:MAG: putative manganese transporter [Candidatus Shapirobacteria bacterium]
MMEILIDALIDSLKTVPLLLILYIVIELMEYKFGDKIREKVQNAGKIGPLIGVMAGIFPQCGFSVIATALFTQKLLTIGTLLAVYLSTSDEAIPIILSQPDKAYLVLPLIGIKIVIALVVGYGVDFFFRKDEEKIIKHIKSVENGHDNKNHNHEIVLNETACCGHSTSAASKKFDIKEIFWHPIVHTFNVFIFIFLITLIINFAVFQLGETFLNDFFTKNIFWQPFLAATIGLIPNCAASVAITELFLKNIIGLGPAVAGLLASAGLGLLILYREEKNKNIFFKVLAILYGVSVLSGLVIQLFG